MKFDVNVDTSDVEKKIKNLLDFTHNFKPFFIKVLGRGPSSEPWTIRGGIHYSIEKGQSPDGQRFAPLSPIYDQWKSKNYSGDLPTLMLSGHLYESLVYENNDTVLKMSETSLVFGTSVPYAAALHYGYKKRKLPSRKYMGYRRNQKERIELELRKYITDAWMLKLTGRS